MHERGVVGRNRECRTHAYSGLTDSTNRRWKHSRLLRIPRSSWWFPLVPYHPEWRSTPPHPLPPTTTILPPLSLLLPVPVAWHYQPLNLLAIRTWNYSQVCSWRVMDRRQVVRHSRRVYIMLYSGLALTGNFQYFPGQDQHNYTGGKKISNRSNVLLVVLFDRFSKNKALKKSICGVQRETE